MDILFIALEQSFLILPLILGMYISYEIMKITDLTVDGTYVLGAGIFARTIDFGLFPALIFSMLAGMIVGSIVSFMQKNDRICSLIAGILASFMLYSVNLRILRRHNISILGTPTILSLFNLENWLIPLIITNCIIIISLVFLLNGRLGLLLRAFGYNKNLLGILGKRPEVYRTIGLALSNGLAALTGALAAQVNGFADINMGIGLALTSVGAIVIGLHIFRGNPQYFHIFRQVIACFVGIFFYFVSLSSILHIGIDPVNLKLVLGVILFISLQRNRNYR
ncbi:ABC transporter permease subunit [Wolbachia endosymbiont (group A) of Lypha dubia]|uniref:ABC transporter permease subunit n=1 Tax=Wolbachia endosymbiont (group A) of Lypha dubia TaxID=3066146 RepID=UPI00333FBD8C